MLITVDYDIFRHRLFDGDDETTVQRPKAQHDTMTLTVKIVQTQKMVRAK